MFSSTGIRFCSWTIRACSELSSALKARRLAFSPAPGGQAWGPAGAKSSSASANAWRPPSHQNPPQHSSSCKSRKSLGGSAPISNHPASRPQPSWLSIRRENLLRHARHSYARCGRRGHLWDDYGWYCTACDDHGDGRPHSPKPSRRRDRDQPPLRRKPYVCHRASLRFRSRYCDVERGHWRDVVENRRDLEAVPPLTWKGSQVRSLYRPPAFARAAREGCHAEAQRAKAGRPSASYGRQASKADPSAARPSPWGEGGQSRHIPCAFLRSSHRCQYCGHFCPAGILPAALSAFHSLPQARSRAYIA